MSSGGQELKKALTPLHLWAIGIGMVISGTYFGWNFGLADGGYVGMLIATGFMGLMYLCMVLSIAELSVMMPHAGGPYAFVRRAIGPLGGFLCGIGVILEYFIACPVVSLGIGGYVNFLFNVDPIVCALIVYVIFILVHMWGIKEYATLETIIVFISLGLVVIMYAVGASSVSADNLFPAAFDSLIPNGFTGIWACMPYAMWLFLALEMLPMLAEECKDAKKDMPRGLISAMITLLVMSTITVTVVGGMGGMEQMSVSESPLPDAVASVFGPDFWLVKLLGTIGILGLVASFSGCMLAFSRQVFALGRAGYFPKFFGHLNVKRRTPHWALILPSIVGLVLVVMFDPDQLILLATFGALTSYLLMSLSCIIIRNKEPEALRPFKCPLYPVTPAIAVVLAAIALFSSIFVELQFFLISVCIFAAATIYYFAYAKKRIDPNAPEERFALEALTTQSKGNEVA